MHMCKWVYPVFLCQLTSADFVLYCTMYKGFRLLDQAPFQILAHAHWWESMQCAPSHCLHISILPVSTHAIDLLMKTVLQLGLQVQSSFPWAIRTMHAAIFLNGSWSSNLKTSVHGLGMRLHCTAIFKVVVRGIWKSRKWKWKREME